MFLIKLLQIIQNKAARAVTKLSWFTSTEELLNQCGWLRVNQLIMYHSLVMVYKMIKSKMPMSMHDKMTRNDHIHNTRTWVHIRDGSYGSNLKIGPKQSANHVLTQRSFRWRSSEQWNKLPIEIRHSKNTQTFKRSIKKWIKLNVPLKVERQF